MEETLMKKNFCLWFVVVALCCLLGLTGYSNAQRSNSMSQTWEYRVDSVPTQQAAMQSLLNQRGAEGWELVAIGDFIYFERAK